MLDALLVPARRDRHLGHQGHVIHGRENGVRERCRRDAERGRGEHGKRQLVGREGEGLISATGYDRF